MAYGTNKGSPVFPAYANDYKPYAICSFLWTNDSSHARIPCSRLLQKLPGKCKLMGWIESPHDFGRVEEHRVETSIGRVAEVVVAHIR